MTLEQIENLFPSGFHDAELLSFRVDLPTKMLTFDLEVDLTSPERELAPGEPDTKRIRVTVTGLEYFKVDPPEVSSANYSLEGGWIDSGKVADNPELMEAAHRESLPDGCFANWIFLKEWNAFMVIAGRNAEYKEVPATEYSQSEIDK